MSKAEEFIQNYTRNCSNEILSPYPQINNDIRRIDGEPAKEFSSWLTPDQARRPVEIAREETLQEVKEKLLMMLNTSIDNKQFFEQLDDYIDELENKQ